MKIISFAVALTSLCSLLPNVLAKESRTRGSAPTQSRRKAQSKGGSKKGTTAFATGAQEVPMPVETITYAELSLDFDAGLTEASFELLIEDGIGVTQVHLHCEEAGQNGQVFTFLLGPIDARDFDGLAVEGTLTNADITPQTCGPNDFEVNNIASAYAAIRQDLVYVNVHTTANPAGEVRGQIFLD